MTDAEVEALREEMKDQREAIRVALAEELGGDPDEYRADRQPVADGGDR
jgi:hypothetical protein